MTITPIEEVAARHGVLNVAPRDRSRDLKALIEQGWMATYAELFGQSFVDSLDSAETDDKHHSEAIEWHWNARIALLKGERPPNDWFAYFPIWSRGNMKTMIAEAMAVIDAMLSVAYGKPGFCLYIGREKDKVKENISNIETLLSLPKVRLYAPGLSHVKRNDETGQKRQWTGTFLHTEAQYVFKGATVESAQAGSKIEGTRVTFFLPDDIDSRDESPVIAETKFRLLTSEILPMRQANTLTFFAQNLINRFSTMYRIQAGKSAVLANRKITEPIPAVRGLVTERRVIDGKFRDIVVAGKPTWRVWDIQRIQDEIDTYTLPVFLTECHPAGTRVRLGWSQNTPIEQVRVNDYVLTHENRLRRVTDLVRRDYTGELYYFKVANASIPLVATSSHPILSAIPPVNWRWQGKKRNPENLVIAWHLACELSKGTYLLEPIPLAPVSPSDGQIMWTFKDALLGRPAKGNREIVATSELFRLLGYYLAEGRVDGGAVKLWFHENETEYIEDVVQLFADVFGVHGRTYPDNGRSVRVECLSTIAAQFFLSVGVGSHFKNVPNWAFSASDVLIKQLIIGYWRGDGCKDPSGFAYNTVSEQLAEHIRLLLLRLGIVAGLYKLKERDVKLPQGTIYRRSMHWQGDINGYYAVKMGELVGVPHEGKGTRRSCFIHAGYVWKPVRSVTKETVQDFPVFNLEVEGDESYIAENIVSHNCQHEVQQSREGVILYNYNDAIHVISESEFAAKFGDKKAWLTWRKKLGNDWARTKTDKHANVAAWLCKSPADSAFPNTTYLMCPMSFPQNSSAEDVAERALSTLSPMAYGNKTWRELRTELLRQTNAPQHTSNDSERLDYERGQLSKIIPKYSRPLLQRCNVQAGDMSHEMDTVRKIYSQVYGLTLRANNPGKHGGTEAICRDMQVDYDEPHPFRSDDKGYTRWFMVVPDDKTQQYTLDNQQRPVYKPTSYPEAFQTDDLNDGDLFRFGFSNWRYRPPLLSASGEAIDDPEKLYDDAANCLQMLYTGSPLTGTSLTEEQKIQLLMPQDTLTAFDRAETAEDKLSAVIDLEFQRDMAEQQLFPERSSEEYAFEEWE